MCNVDIVSLNPNVSWRNGYISIKSDNMYTERSTRTFMIDTVYIHMRRGKLCSLHIQGNCDSEVAFKGYNV
jgi:hypothetical protein